ncbi:MAG TPA: AAA family ATPase [Candidatus Tectomicrobia bacterium]
MSDPRGKVRDIYTFVSEHLYLGRPDLEIQGEAVNATLLLSLLTTLIGGKALIIGEPGLGKTTAAEYICALVYGFPLGVIWSSVVAGHPEQTEEKIIGRPNLGKLNQGEEEVVWSYFARLPVKIVDEINRLPETKQSLILDGVERGKWEYLNQGLLNDEFCLFATANYQDQGTNTLIPPLLDRFDILVESKHPGANLAYLIGQSSARDTVLRHAASEEAFLEVLRNTSNGQPAPSSLESLHRRFAKVILQRCGVTVLRRAERQAVQQEVAALEMDLAASTFLRMVLAELSFCCKYGQKRSSEVCDEGCHYTGYLCYEVRNCVSNRLPGALHRYAQALAWWLGDERVAVEHIRTILPYALAHRTQWRESYLVTRERERRREPLLLHAARQATEAIFRRFHEQRYEMMQALHTAARLLDGEELPPPQGDHPLYAEIRRDLGLE